MIPHCPYLLQLKRGDIVNVSLDAAVNVRLMDSTAYAAYRDGRDYSYTGGLPSKSPVRLMAPNPGQWYLCLDAGGGSFRVAADVRIIHPPRIPVGYREGSGAPKGQPVTIVLPFHLYARLKDRAVEQEKKLGDVVLQALRTFLKW